MNVKNTVLSGWEVSHPLNRYVAHNINIFYPNIHICDALEV